MSTGKTATEERRAVVEVDFGDGVVNLQDALRINPEDLYREVSEHPANYIYWAALAASAEEFSRKTQLRLDVIEARLSKEIRLSFKKSGDKPTEAKILQEIHLTDEWQDAKVELIEAKKNAEVARSTERAFFSKKDQLYGLVQMSGRERGMEARIRGKREELDG